MRAEENETGAAARAAKAAETGRIKAEDAARARRWRLGSIGVGIGSAAVAAAVLYARRERD